MHCGLQGPSNLRLGQTGPEPVERLLVVHGTDKGAPLFSGAQRRAETPKGYRVADRESGRAQTLHQQMESGVQQLAGLEAPGLARRRFLYEVVGPASVWRSPSRR